MNPQEKSIVTTVVREIFDELYALRDEVEVLRRAAEQHKEDLARLMQGRIKESFFECVEVSVDQRELLSLHTERERSEYIVEQLAKALVLSKPLVAIRRNATDDGLKAYCFVARLP